jgi:hypothetical protein
LIDPSLPGISEDVTLRINVILSQTKAKSLKILYSLFKGKMVLEKFCRQKFIERKKNKIELLRRLS